MRTSDDSGSQSNPVRILHLEDDPTDAQIIKALIEETDHGFFASVELVTTKAAYRAALRSRGFDVVLSDHILPGYDGDEALKDAKAICPDIPFIMVSGELGEERAIETLKAGATDYVLKDGIKRLIPAIKRALKDAALVKDSRETEYKYPTIVETAGEGIVLGPPGSIPDYGGASRVCATAQNSQRARQDQIRGCSTHGPVSETAQCRDEGGEVLRDTLQG